MIHQGSEGQLYYQFRAMSTVVLWAFRFIFFGEGEREIVSSGSSSSSGGRIKTGSQSRTPDIQIEWVKSGQHLL